MRTDWRIRVLGGLFLVPVVPVLLLVPEPLGGMLSFASGATGLFLLIVVANRQLPADTVEAMVHGNAASIADVREALNLTGSPTYLPDPDGARLFLPTVNDDRIPPLMDGQHALWGGGKSTKAGIAIRIAGNIDVGEGIQEAEASLQAWLKENDLGRIDMPDHLHVRLHPGAVEPPCMNKAEPDCLSTGCNLCHTIGCTLAKSLQRGIQVTQATTDGHVDLRFKEV